MGGTVLVGTQKGAVVLRGQDDGAWSIGPLQLRGWLVTAFAQDATGRTYAAVTHDVYGSAVMASDDLEHWQQLPAAPRYRAEQLGNADHNRTLGASDPMGQYSAEGRHVDQIWKLLAVGDRLYAGVSEAGIFVSEDRGKSWRALPGIDVHPDRERWGPGFGGLCLHTILADENDPRRLWVGISAAGAFRSDDGGETFRAINEGVVPGGEGWCVHSMSHDPSAPDVIFRQDHHGVYVSRDAGDTWQRAESGLPTSELASGESCTFGFASGFDRNRGAAFVVPMEGDSFRFPHDGQLTVFRSRDGGGSWTGHRAGLPDGCYANVLRGALAVDDGDPGGVYFGTTGGSVFGSRDLGESWRELVANLPKVLCVAAFPP